MSFEKLPIVIVGAGPAGLACGKELAKAGEHVIIIERKADIGKKVCAGGITWNGQLQNLPDKIIQRKFFSQKLYTPHQEVELSSDAPMLATVDREELGRYMASQTIIQGAEIRTDTFVSKITEHHVATRHNSTKDVDIIQYKVLIGADGADSIVRKYLGIPVRDFGTGIHFTLERQVDQMEWHFAPEYFDNGYAWVFPHRDTVSIGAYCDKRAMKPAQLKVNLLHWASQRGYQLDTTPAKARRINYDYQGWNFGNMYLIGEAAGMTSALTGEGINAAILMGDFLAKYLQKPQTYPRLYQELIKKWSSHKHMVEITRKSQFKKLVLPELMIAALRFGLIGFEKLELTK